MAEPEGRARRVLDRLKRMAGPGRAPATRSTSGRAGARRRASSNPPSDEARENRIRMRLHDDPNDEKAFDELAQIVRRRAVAGHTSDDDPLGRPNQVMDMLKAENDAVWALAEEIAGSSKAWYPLIEMARLSVNDDREAALRRLGTAAERDPSGKALAEGLRMLRDVKLYTDALNLGTGHWRPKDHELAVGDLMVRSAVDAGRGGEARRNLASMSAHPGFQGYSGRAELQRLIESVPATGAVPKINPTVDLRAEQIPEDTL